MLPRLSVAAALVALACSRAPKAVPHDLALSCRALPGCTDACAEPACAEACVRRLTAAARQVYQALQACVVPACADADAGASPCRVPSSFACKMCVLSRCAAPAAACMQR